MNQRPDPFAWRSIVAAGILLTPALALAVVRNDGTVGNPEDFPFAVQIGDASEFFCSGTVIGGGTHVITAQHCLFSGSDASSYRVMNDDGAVLSGVGEVAFHPSLDIAIIPLDGALTDSVSIFSSFDEVGREVAFAGYGLSSALPGGGAPDLAFGTKRVGYNLLEFVGSGNVGFDFDLAGGVGSLGLGDREATTFQGDSGVGYVTEVNPGQYSILGVHTGITPATVNQDQVISFGVRLSEARDWIHSNIPAPGPVALSAIGLACANRRRRAW